MRGSTSSKSLRNSKSILAWPTRELSGFLSSCEMVALITDIKYYLALTLSYNILDDTSII